MGKNSGLWSSGMASDRVPRARLVFLRGRKIADLLCATRMM